jgi:flavodoxin
MRSLIVYESMFGNTEHVARAIAAGISKHMEVELVPVTDASVHASGAYDLVVVGGPTHAFSMSRPSTREDAQRQGAHATTATKDVGIREWLDALPQRSYSGLAATFDTRVARVRHLPGSAAKKAAKVLHRHGLSIVSTPQSFYVDDTDGPLIDGEIERAEAWGNELARRAVAANPSHQRP